MQSRRYRSEDFEIHVEIRDGRDPTVVLLHGAAGHAGVWESTLDAFGDRRLVLVDLPGHGESPSSDDWSLERSARDLARTIGHKHEGRLVWGGHSWGGKTAAILGALVPSVVRARSISCCASRLASNWRNSSVLRPRSSRSFA